MKKMLLIISILLTTQMLRAETSEIVITKEMMKDLVTAGEHSGETPAEEKALLMNRISNLLSWTYSKDKKVEITSGVFGILNPRKTKNLSEIDLKLYKETFAADRYGTGFLYKDYIVTNYHVCRGLNVIIRDYNDKIAGAEVLGYNAAQDVCILKAPESVKNQRNFADYKMPLDLLEEQIELTRVENKMSDIQDQGSEKFAILKARKSTLQKEINFEELRRKSVRSPAETTLLATPMAFSKKSYAEIIGVFGKSYVYNIGFDSTDDMWKKENASKGYGKKCESGMSGSPLVSANGLIGLMWGAEEPDAQKARVYLKHKAKNHEENRICYFVNIEEIEKVIAAVEKKK